jgi:hypothetical protein
MFVAELQVSARPIPRIPIWLVAGSGIAKADGRREYDRDGETSAYTHRSRAFVEPGLEIALGRSKGAPRLQLTRQYFSSRILDAESRSTFGILLPWYRSR